MTANDKAFLRGLARAYGGALLFALPLFMTMEMWWLGYYMSRYRLLLLLLCALPLLIGLSYHSGFRETFSLREDAVDAAVAYAVGSSASLLILLIASVISTHDSLREIAGKTVLQAIPGSMGAMLAQSQMGDPGKDQSRPSRPPTYAGELFIMGAGAIFMALNIAPTEEIVVIAQRTSAWQAAAMVVLSLAVLHGFVFAMRFRGHAEAPPGTPGWNLFLRFSVVGYAIVLLLSMCMLWLFGRLDGLSALAAWLMVIVLAIPASIGAAAARLIL